MGWSIPISNLIYWIKGIPAPNFDYKIKLDSYNHLLKLKQQDWVINYTDSKSQDGIDLPSNMALQNAQCKIKIAIKEWSIEK